MNERLPFLVSLVSFVGLLYAADNSWLCVTNAAYA